MGLTAFQLRKSSHRSRRVFIRRRGNRERDEHLIRVQARILPAQIGRLQRLDRLDRLRRNDLQLMRYSRNRLQCVYDHRRSGTKELCRLAGDHRAVRQLDRAGGCTGLLSPLHRRRNDFPVFLNDMRLLHEKLDLIGFLLTACPVGQAGKCFIVSPDDLLLRRLPADFVVDNAVSCHVDAHICR